MSEFSSPTFIDNPAIAGRSNAYATLQVDVGKTLKSWQKSLFSFEWLNPDGTIRTFEQLPDKEKPKRRDVEERIANNEAMPKPVLGIGIMDNVEIGIGRAEFLTLAAHGVKEIPVHVPQSNEKDFRPFLAKPKE